MTTPTPTPMTLDELCTEFEAWMPTGAGAQDCQIQEINHAKRKMLIDVVSYIEENRPALLAGMDNAALTTSHAALVKALEWCKELESSYWYIQAGDKRTLAATVDKTLAVAKELME